MSFWQKLQLPIIGLSPMDGVTDHPFRYITKKYGQPAVMYTEFTSVEGVCHGARQLLKDFLYDETQRPIIGQIYGTTPKFFRQTATLLCQLGFDGIDINMGCPAKNVAHSGAGAALIKTPKLAQEIIRQTKLGIEDWVNGKTARDCEDITEEICVEVEKRHQQLPSEYQQRRSLPVSVKTRIGYDQPSVEEWIPNLLEMEPDAIALHGRTLKQQYGGQANWEMIAQAAELTHQAGVPLLGNGDIRSFEDAQQKIQTYKTDGVLLGRVSMGNPFVFSANPPADAAEKMFQIALEHAQLFEQTYQNEEKYNFLPMRKHLGWYVHDIANAAKIRQEIYQCNSSSDFIQVMEKYGIFSSASPGTNDILQPLQLETEEDRKAV
jgi:tRNA-dihydrouridine synthase B